MARPVRKGEGTRRRGSLRPALRRYLRPLSSPAGHYQDKPPAFETVEKRLNSMAQQSDSPEGSRKAPVRR
jgi:hypothetical protein